MSQSTPLDLLPMFTKGLEMSAVTSGETVAIYMEGGQRRDYAAAFTAAAQSLGATVFTVDVPAVGRRTKELQAWSPARSLGARPQLVQAFKDCDLLIDLVMLLFQPEKMAIQAAGTRILTCVEPPDVIERLFPTEALRGEALRGEERLRGAKSLRVRSEAGTDLVYQLGDRIPFCQYGLADAPGRWDHFASTFVATAGNDGGVDGTVVFDIGDVITPYIHHVREPVTLTIEGGYVTDVAGGLEARFMLDQFDRFDRDARAVSHIGWGLHPGARWDALHVNPNHIGLDPRSYRGCVMFSTGPNNEFGGTNSSACHFDMPMRGCSLWVDDVLIVDRGVVIDGSTPARARVAEESSA